MRRTRSGFTLIETLVVVAIAAVLLAVVVPSMAGMLERQRVQGTAEQAALDLHEARAEALSRQESVFVTATMSSGGGSCYVVSVGSAGGCRCAVAGPALCDAASTALKNVGFEPTHPVQLLSATSPAVTINSLRAQTAPGTTYTFGSADGFKMKVVVSERKQRMCVSGEPGCP
jgi:type IV fimbrial biogenesis protein FimT